MGHGGHWNRAARRSGGSRPIQVDGPAHQPGLRDLILGSIKPFIIKVQVSLSTTHQKPQILAYNRARTLEWTGDCAEDVLKLLGDKKKAFFWATIQDGEFMIDRPCEDQDW